MQELIKHVWAFCYKIQWSKPSLVTSFKSPRLGSSGGNSILNGFLKSKKYRFPAEKLTRKKSWTKSKTNPGFSISQLFLLTLNISGWWFKASLWGWHGWCFKTFFLTKTNLTRRLNLNGKLPPTRFLQATNQICWVFFFQICFSPGSTQGCQRAPRLLGVEELRGQGIRQGAGLQNCETFGRCLFRFLLCVVVL